MGVCSQNKSSNESKRTRLCLLLPSDLLFWKLLNFTTCFVQICEGYNIDRTMEVDMDKRAYSDPEDPRNLFAAMYGGVYKREDPYDFRCGIYYYLHIYISTDIIAPTSVTAASPPTRCSI